MATTTVARPVVQPLRRDQLAEPAYQAYSLLRIGFANPIRNAICRCLNSGPAIG